MEINFFLLKIRNRAIFCFFLISIIFPIISITLHRATYSIVISPWIVYASRKNPVSHFEEFPSKWTRNRNSFLHHPKWNWDRISLWHPSKWNEIENQLGTPKMKLKILSNSMKNPVGNFQEIQRSNPKVRPNTKPKNKKWARTPNSYTSKVKSKKMLTSAKSQGQGQTGIILSTDS